MGDRRRPGEGSCLCGPCRSCVFPVQVASCTGHCGGWALLHRSVRGLGRGRLRGTSDPLRPIGSPAMPVRTPCPTAPSAAERVRLKKMAYGHKTEHRLRVRAQVAPHAARGRSNACAARETGLHVDTVRRWRGRFAQAGLPGSKTVNAAAVPPRSHRCGPPRSRHWPAGCLPGVTYRSHAGRARNWPARPPGGASPRSCRRRPCVAGWPRTRSSPGSTAPGSSSPAPASD